MNRKVVGGVVALALIGVAVWFFVLRGGDKPATPGPTAARTGEVDKPTTTTPPRAGGGGDNAGGGGARSAEWSLDPDREGTLVLDGQVIDAAGKGVGGAQVFLGSVPERSTTSNDDGTFTFDKLVSRTYALQARSGTQTGGIQYKLLANGDPAVIRVSEGASVQVTVVDAKDAPISGAEVFAGGLGELAVKTDATGVALLQPVEPGYVGIEAKANGFAPVRTFTTVGSGGAKGAIRITLQPGFPISGRVVDERGTAIAKVRVTVSQGPWGSWDRNERDQTLTNAKGEFSIPAVSPGRHTLYAVDGEHAPARSAPISIGDKPVTGVEVTMKAGGSIKGSVVDIAGKPVPFAVVRVAGAGSDIQTVQARQANADMQGIFELRGLARAKMHVRAESETAASKLADVDLATTAERADLKLVLDVTGTIAGVVVDSLGKPMPEVQVNAFPDFLSGGASTEGIALAGMATASSDGDGKFLLHGLADGKYRLWPDRGSNSRFDWGQDGVVAAVGEQSVKLVMQSPGGIKGKIVIDGGTVPKVASVQAGWEPPTSAQDGAFEVRGLKPGSFDVRVRGPEFSELVKRNIKIEPGQVVDLGEIVVKRGRRLAGKVVTKDGAPVAGAKIKLGDFIFYAEGEEDSEESWQDLYGIRSSVTDQEGNFTVVGVPEKGTQAAADHSLGRSDPAPIPPGKEDPPAITLTLKGFGSVVGKVMRDGQPLTNVNVTHSSRSGGKQMAMTKTDDTGSFRLDKVPEGSVALQAMTTEGMMSARLHSVTVEVVAGKESVANIDFPVGQVELAITIQPKDGADLSMAMVVLVQGTTTVANAGELTELGSKGGVVGQMPWTPGQTPSFKELVPGAYSLCSVPISGNPMDPRLQEHMMTLKVYCQGVALAAAPAKQSVTQILPAMEPLPTE